MEPSNGASGFRRTKDEARAACDLSPNHYAVMNQAAEKWKDFAPEFYRDGSLRDIYVFKTLLDDWTNAARYIVDQGYRISFSGVWTESVFPPNIGTLFPTGPDSELTLMSINVSSVWINCHFFSVDEIEFDLDPAEIVESAKLSAIFDFMSGLANAVGKDVVMTPEGMSEIVVFRCRPGTDKVEHTPFTGFA